MKNLPDLTPGERRRVSPREARQLIKQGTGTINIKTCFGKSVTTSKKAAYDLLDSLPDEPVTLFRSDLPHYYFLFLSA